MGKLEEATTASVDRTEDDRPVIKCDSCGRVMEWTDGQPDAEWSLTVFMLAGTDYQSLYPLCEECKDKEPEESSLYISLICLGCGQEFSAYSLSTPICARCLAQGVTLQSLQDQQEAIEKQAKEQTEQLLKICSRMAPGDFVSLAAQGQIRSGTVGPPPHKFGSSRSCLSQGLSEGFTLEDIAHFYLHKRLPDRDREALRQGQTDSLPSHNVELAYSELCEDIVWELGVLTQLPEMGFSVEELWRMAELEQDEDEWQ